MENSTNGYLTERTVSGVFLSFYLNLRKGDKNMLKNKVILSK